MGNCFSDEAGGNQAVGRISTADTTTPLISSSRKSCVHCSANGDGGQQAAGGTQHSPIVLPPPTTTTSDTTALLRPSGLMTCSFSSRKSWYGFVYSRDIIH